MIPTITVKRYLTYKKDDTSLRLFKGIFYTMIRMIQLSSRPEYRKYTLNIKFLPKFITEIPTIFNGDQSVDISEYLDLLYYAHSGNKAFAKNMFFLFDLFNRSNTDEICDEILANLITTMCMKYKTKWDELYDLYNTEYNPLSNYNLEEDSVSNKENNKSEIDNETTKDVTNKDNTYENKTINDVNISTHDTENNESRDNEKSTTSNENKNNIGEAIFGFNSGTTGVNSNESINNGYVNTEEITNKDTENSKNKISDEKSSSIVNDDYKSNSNENRDINKINTIENKEKENSNKNSKQNGIKNISYQELFTMELEKLNNIFLENIFHDIDEYIALEVY